MRVVTALPFGGQLLMNPDNGEPFIRVRGGGAVCRPHEIRFSTERNRIWNALNEEENRRILAKPETHTKDWEFWCIRRARLWLEWDPEKKTFDEQMVGV